MTRQARLLVVDDEEINLEIISEFLDGEPYDLDLVDGGEEALERFAQGVEYDAVILDRMMPRVDGMEVLRRMKAEPRLLNIPVILQTAAAAPEQVAEGLRLGAYYYLTKPYHRDSLRAVVRSAVGTFTATQDLASEIDRYQGTLSLLYSGVLRFCTLRHARSLTAALSGLAADPQSACLGLGELLVNAVEHGNLGITFHDKARLLSEDRWEQEVEARLASPQYADKYVEVHLEREQGLLNITIRDQGPGFDWQRYLELDEGRAMYPNGRGIALARHIGFRSLAYRGTGSEVFVTLVAAPGHA